VYIAGGLGILDIDEGAAAVSPKTARRPADRLGLGWLDDDAAVIHVNGKGGEERSVLIEAPAL
jgi:hypothetical protein